MKGPQTWQMLSSYGICSEGQNQLNVEAHLVGPAQGRVDLGVIIAESRDTQEKLAGRFMESQ